MAAIPAAVDIVDCFRKPEEMPALARDAVAKGAKVLWMQLGIRSEEARADRELPPGSTSCRTAACKIEHARIMGGLHWAGVNTGVISANALTPRLPKALALWGGATPLSHG